jgi:hypothetical protein
MLMSHTHHRHRAPRLTPAQRVWRAIWTNAPFALLAVAIAVFAAAMLSLGGQPVSAGATTPTDWIALANQSPDAIIQAARQSRLFHVNRSGNGDYLHDLSRLGTPQLVVGYTSHPGASALADYYIIPVLDSSGNSIGAVEACLNANHSAIYVQSIDTYTQPRPHGAIAQLDIAQATQVLAAAHVGFAAAPQLVYFAFNFRGEERGDFTWHAGGQFPSDPVWLIHGFDGHDHIIGTDGVDYAPSQLPATE